MSIKANLSQYWEKIQGTLFPYLEEMLPPLSKKQQQLVAILEVIRIEESLSAFCRGFRGRPEKSRKAIARAFVAKAVYNMPTTTFLIERLHTDSSLRRICGWESNNQIPSESVFSRAFTEFAHSELATRVHASLIKEVYENEIVGHVIIDASAIEAREKPVKEVKNITEICPKTKPKRCKKGEQSPKEMTRIEKQASGTMSLEEMLLDLPRKCNVGAKTNSKGSLQWWIGYKLHLSADGNGVPLAGIVTSASMNDTQAAIPLSKLTAQRVHSLYDLMDSGYHVDAIMDHSRSLGHVPIFERQSKKEGEKEEKRLEKLAWKTLNWKPAEWVRYESRTCVERVFSRLKDEFGASLIRVRSAIKVTAHLMFGILALAADQLLKIPIP
jgi:transposase